MKYIPIKMPHRLVADQNVYIWLEELADDNRWYWRDLPDAHYLYLVDEDMVAFRLKFDV